MSGITKADVVDSFSEVIDALTALADREDREMELIVRTDGTACLMGAELMTPAGESATGFEEVARFESFDELWAYLHAEG
jgi:hypothetical protein